MLQFEPALRPDDPDDKGGDGGRTVPGQMRRCGLQRPPQRSIAPAARDVPERPQRRRCDSGPDEWLVFGKESMQPRHAFAQRFGRGRPRWPPETLVDDGLHRVENGLAVRKVLVHGRDGDARVLRDSRHRQLRLRRADQRNSSIEDAVAGVTGPGSTTGIVV